MSLISAMPSGGGSPKVISENYDMNDLWDIGDYICPLPETAATISNAPWNDINFHVIVTDIGSLEYNRAQIALGTSGIRYRMVWTIEGGFHQFSNWYTVQLVE